MLVVRSPNKLITAALALLMSPCLSQYPDEARTCILKNRMQYTLRQFGMQKTILTGLSVQCTSVLEQGGTVGEEKRGVHGHENCGDH